jgi:hypothetical protein
MIALGELAGSKEPRCKQIPFDFAQGRLFFVRKLARRNDKHFEKAYK